MMPLKNAERSGLQLGYRVDLSANPSLSGQNNSSTNTAANLERLLSELFGGPKEPSLTWKQPSRDAAGERLSSPDPSLLSFQDGEEGSEISFRR